MNDAATSQIYKIQVNTKYEPPFRGAGGQNEQEEKFPSGGQGGKNSGEERAV
jgi:hypothetical protein